MVRKLLFALSIIAAITLSAHAATVSGIVTDTGATPSPLLDAIVSISPQNGGGGPGGGGTTYRDTTDATGAYSIPIATAGAYRISATRRGSVNSARVNFTLATADTTIRIKLAPLPIGVIISGIIYDSTAGVALTPLVGATVRLQPGYAGGIMDSVVTGADGKYSMDSVQVGGVTLNISAFGFASQTTGNITVGTTPVTRDIKLVRKPVGVTVSGLITDSTAATVTNLEAVTVTLRSGNTDLATKTTSAEGTFAFDSILAGTYTIRASRAGFTTKNTPVTVLAVPVTASIQLVKAVTVSGTITDSTAAIPTPLKGVTVTLRSGNNTIATKTTGDDGVYAFDSVVAGTYTVRALLAGFTTKNTSLSVAAAAITADFQLVKAASVSGVVTDSVLATPLVGVTVTLRSGNNGNTVVATKTTGVDGTFTFDSVQAGTYTARALLAGFTTKNMPITVAAASITVNFPLIKAPSISGVVTDSIAAANLAGVTVTLRQGNTVLATKTTVADGAYSFDTVQPGTYTVRATLASFTTKNITVVIAASSSTTNIPLVKLPSVAGLVTDSVAATKLAGVTVTLRSGNTVVATRTTDTTGSYVFDTIQPGTYTVRAAMAGFTTKNISVPASVGVATVNISLVKSVTVSGTITDSAAGTNVSGVTVTLRSGNTVVATKTTGETGAYAFDSIQAGSYTIRASLTGYATKNVSITIGAVAATQNIQIVKGITYVTVSGSVKDSANNANKAGAFVSLLVNDTTIIARDTTDTNGLYSFTRIQQGSYTVRTVLSGFTKKDIAITVAAVAVTQNIALVKEITYVTVSGTVKDSASDSIRKGVAMSLLFGDSTIAVDTTDSTGKYSFDSLKVGSYVVKAALSGYATKNTTVAVAAVPVTANVVLVATNEVGAFKAANQMMTGKFAFSVSSKGFLRVFNCKEAGNVKIFSFNGKLLYHNAINAQTSTISLPAGMLRTGNAYIVNITQGKTLYRKQVALP